jgi:F0F1-type ATP synthase membrane subunit c/vacuolar-type H+-ATPase subunit K
MTGDIIVAAKFIGAGLSMIGALGAGIGIGLSVQGALQAWRVIQIRMGTCSPI